MKDDLTENTSRLVGRTVFKMPMSDITLPGGFVSSRPCSLNISCRSKTHKTCVKPSPDKERRLHPDHSYAIGLPVSQSPPDFTLISTICYIKVICPRLSAQIRLQGEKWKGPALRCLACWRILIRVSAPG